MKVHIETTVQIVCMMTSYSMRQICCVMISYSIRQKCWWIYWQLGFDFLTNDLKDWFVHVFFAFMKYIIFLSMNSRFTVNKKKRLDSRTSPFIQVSPRRIQKQESELTRLCATVLIQHRQMLLGSDENKAEKK